MKKFTVVLLIILVVSCQKKGNTDKKVVVDDMHNAKNFLDYVGIYKGILPCADCNGLQTEIAINENSTFCIKTKYDGKGDKVFVQKGNFSWNKQGNTIILKGVNGANQYFVGEQTLTQLDVYGKKSTGSFADEYILSKQPTDTSEIERAEDHNKVTVDLNSRMATTTVIQKVNPAVGKYTLSETKWKLISLNKEKVPQKGKDVYYLKLKSEDGRFVALSSCSNIIGYYAMPSSSTLSFLGITSTKMDCANAVLESHFFTMLAETNSYKLDNKKLTFYGNGKALAEFLVFTE